MRVNPYLFLLLKRIIEFDTEETLRTISNRERVYQHILNSNKNYYSNANVVTAKTLADYIRRYVWSKEDFDFPEHILNKMSQIPSKLGQYSSWSQFESVHGVTPSAINASNYLVRAFYDYSNDVQREISASVELRLAKMYDRYKGRLNRSDKKMPVDINEEDTNITRFATLNDIKLIADLAERVYPCPINNFEVKRPWYEKNNNIFVVCLDEYGELLSNINLIPLSLDFYNKLKSGQIYEDKITANDIHSASEKDNVKCIYVEGYACISTDVQRDFRRRFEKIISKIANTKSKELIICAIGGSVEGDLLMRKYKFQTTGWAVDPKSRTKYPFLEVKWNVLKKAILNQIATSERIS